MNYLSSIICLPSFMCWFIITDMIVFFFELDAHSLYFNTFIIFLYMFRALLCSSSGGQISINSTHVLKKILCKMFSLLLSLQCAFQPGQGWTRGGYQCVCRPGFYSLRQKGVFNGTLIEGKNFPRNLNMSFFRK